MAAAVDAPQLGALFHMFSRCALGAVNSAVASAGGSNHICGGSDACGGCLCLVRLISVGETCLSGGCSGCG